MSRAPEPILVTHLVVQVLEDLDIPYLLGGSLASSFHGLTRSTLDADIVAAMQPEQVKPFTEILGPDFYADESVIVSAIQRQSSFNLIHKNTMFKVDVFIPKQRPFDLKRMERRSYQRLSETPEIAVFVSSAEDTILAKLE